MSGVVEKQMMIGGRTYTLAFHFASMRRAERELGKPIPNLMAEGGIGFDFAGALFWAVLFRDHKLTMEQVENLIDEAGFPAVLTAIMEGVAEHLGIDAPQPPIEEAGDDAAANPPPAKKSKAGKSST